MKYFLSLLHLLIFYQLSYAQNQWTWMRGDKSPNKKGEYGKQGVAEPNNYPGSRTGAVTWTDKEGNFWLFGGLGKGDGNKTGHLNDLWKFSPSSKQWTFVDGDKAVNKTGKYGELGVSSEKNRPGARHNAVAWTDAQGNFWLFGGLGMAASSKDQEKLNEANKPQAPGGPGNGGPGNEGGGRGNGGRGNDGSGPGNGGGRGNGNGRGNGDGNDIVLETNSTIEEGLLNDLWKYSPSTGEWTWVSGSYAPNQQGSYGEKSQSSRDNYPGGRYMSGGWVDGSGSLYLFGGRGYSSQSDIYDLNDVWKFSPSSKEWTWLNGEKSGVAEGRFGEKGQFNDDNTPSGRRGSTFWTDKDGNFWLYGGGTRWTLVNDLWKYNSKTNQWAWIAGGKNVSGEPIFDEQGIPDPSGNPGSRMLATGYTDKENNLWLFGGEGYGVVLSGTRSLNNLWKYSVASNEWTFVKGDASNHPEATYGERGKGADENNPGGTSNPAQWTDKDGNLWIFGGHVADNYLNATWKFNACNEVIQGNVTPASAAICEGGSQVLTATGGNSYEWRLNDDVIEGENKATFKATKAGTYSVIIRKGSCSAPASNKVVISKASAPSGNISPANVAICNGASETLTATGGTSYKWLRDGETISGQTSETLIVTQPGVYSVVITNGSCTGPASNTAAVTLNTSEPGMQYKDVIVDANTPAQLAAREIGIAYEWTPATGLDDPNSAVANVTTAESRQYIVNITMQNGCVVKDTVMVKIKGEAPAPEKKKVAVPSAFSPDGNNVNDLLRPLGKIASINYFRVFNRWGQLMYQTSVIGDGWDGKLKGVPQPSDTYMWLFSGTSTDGTQLKLSGKTLLIR